jgi:hypothetical protein
MTPTEQELDKAARDLIPILDRMAERALEEPHDFTTKPQKRSLKGEYRYGIRSDRLGLTDSIEVELTHEFAPRWCALGDGARARHDPLNLIVELYPGVAGHLELHLCPPHYANLVDAYRRRALVANGPALHFAGRRIIAVNPRPLDVVDILKSSEVPLL